MRLPWGLAVALVAGCTAIYGLHTPVDVDPDGDHVPNGSDNCPDTYNPDQSDIDHNGIGDACDQCPNPSGMDSDGDGIDDACDACDNRGVDTNHDGIPDVCEPGVCTGTGPDSDGDGIPDVCDPCNLGPNHDEDHDGKFDACDNCPSVPNPDQADTGEVTAGNDGVGDACDFDVGHDTQVFDPFVAESKVWYVFGSGWSFGQDMQHDWLQLDAPPGQLSLRFRTQPTPGSKFVVRTHVTLATTPAVTGYVAVAATQLLEQGAPTVACEVVDGGATAVLKIEQTPTGGAMSMPLSRTFVGDHDIELQFDPARMLALCTVDGVSGKLSLAVPGTYYTGVGGNGVSAKLQYFDQIGN